MGIVLTTLQRQDQPPHSNRETQLSQTSHSNRQPKRQLDLVDLTVDLFKMMLSYLTAGEAHNLGKSRFWLTRSITNLLKHYSGPLLRNQLIANSMGTLQDGLHLHRLQSPAVTVSNCDDPLSQSATEQYVKTLDDCIKKGNLEALEAAMKGNQTKGSGIENFLTPELLKKFLFSAAGSGHLNIVTHLLNPANTQGLQISQQGLDSALATTAGSGHLNIITHLLNPDITHGLRISQEGLDSALEYAAGSDHLEIVTYLLNPDNTPGLQISQQGLDRALINAAQGGHLNIITHLLNPANTPGLHISQEGLDEALTYAAQYGRLEIVTHLLKPENTPGLHISQEGLDQALATAAKYSYLYIFTYFLNPDAKHRYLEIVTYLLNPDNTPGLHISQQGLARALTNTGDLEIASLIRSKMCYFQQIRLFVDDHRDLIIAVAITVAVLGYSILQHLNSAPLRSYLRQEESV